MGTAGINCLLWPFHCLLIVSLSNGMSDLARFFCSTTRFLKLLSKSVSLLLEDHRCVTSSEEYNQRVLLFKSGLVIQLNIFCCEVTLTIVTVAIGPLNLNTNVRSPENLWSSVYFSVQSRVLLHGPGEGGLGQLQITIILKQGNPSDKMRRGYCIEIKFN